MDRKRRPLAFIELTFHDEQKKEFSEILKKIVPVDQFYKSPVIGYIDGDVTDSLHCTLFFGLDPQAVYDSELKKIFKDYKFDLLNLGKLQLFEGFQGLYKILTIEVLDRDNSLLEFSDRVSKMRINKHLGHKDFKPHITLAYVNSDYELPDEIPEFSHEIKTKDLQISLT